MSKSTFGQFIRNKRIAAHLSLRAVAEALGVSHVFLGEVERGVRPLLPTERWPRLMQAIPDIQISDLERHAAHTRPIQLDLRDAPPEYQDLGLALARRIAKRDLPEPQLRDLLSLLRDEPDE